MEKLNPKVSRQKRRIKVWLKEPDPKKRTPRPKSIILRSKRGKIFHERMKCSRCGLETSPITRYRESNVGEVFLCNICKDKVRQESFGSIDAFQLRYR